VAAQEPGQEGHAAGRQRVLQDGARQPVDLDHEEALRSRRGSGAESQAADGAVEPPLKTVMTSRAPAEPPIVAAVRRFVDEEVRPVASELEHADRYPQALVARMRELGLFGALIPERWGGLGLDVRTYAAVIEELCRGFMSLAGVVNSHTMMALIVLGHGTDEQRESRTPAPTSRRSAPSLAARATCTS
jgi:hypothetical protein